MTTELSGAKAELHTAAGPLQFLRLGWLAESGIGDPSRLPHTVKILLENLLRRAGTRDVSDHDVRTLANWPAAAPGAAPQVCAKADFEAVVDEAAGSLRDLNMQNKPAFQEKLRQLKDKRGWRHDEFLKEAAPFVRDDKIAVFDQDSEQLLNDISTLGQEGADAATLDCGLLVELRTRMKTLVDTQTAKWTYMFEKLDAALAQ